MTETAALPYFPTTAHDEYDHSEVVTNDLISAFIENAETRMLFVRQNEEDRQLCATVQRLLEDHAADADGMHFVGSWSDIAHGVSVSWDESGGEDMSGPVVFWVRPTDEAEVVYEIPSQAYEPWDAAHVAMFDAPPGRAALVDALTLDDDRLQSAFGIGPDDETVARWHCAVQRMRSTATKHDLPQVLSC